MSGSTRRWWHRTKNRERLAESPEATPGSAISGSETDIRKERRMRRRRAVGVVLAAICLCVAMLLAIGAPRAQAFPTLQTGDLLFQTTKGRLALVIHAATHSKITHVGVVVMRGGVPWVLEASGPVAMTRLRRFVDRGVGKRVVVKRLAKRLTAYQQKKLVKAGRRFLAVRYDGAFRWSDSRMYCSELVWKAYERGPGIRLVEPETMGDLYNSYNPIVTAFAARKYGKNLPVTESIVTPKRLFDSSMLVTIYDDTWF